MPQTIGQAWRRARDEFAAIGIVTAALDARLLAAYAFGLTDLQIMIEEKSFVPIGGQERFEDLVARRLLGEPVARILGVKSFFGLDFYLGEATLVPRPETELLVDLALEFLPANQVGHILDLGTGSGCIPVAILTHRPLVTGIATDLSDDAVLVAQNNAQRLGVVERLRFHQGSWFAPLATDEQFTLIVSNPPYIETLELADLQPEVRLFDPMLALDGGADGLAPYRVIAKGAIERLLPGGAVMVEFGSMQAKAVLNIFASAGFSVLDVHKDLAGHDRVLVARRQSGGQSGNRL